MGPLRAVLRAFVYATEAEDRVVRALLDAAGLAADAGSRGRITRQRLKSHFGAEILLLELVLKTRTDLTAALSRWSDAPGLGATLRSERAQRLDEANVLHFRLDKQALVDGRLELATGGDAIVVEVKYDPLRAPRGREFP